MHTPFSPPLWSISKLKMIPYEMRDSDRTRGVTMPGGYWVEECVVETTFVTFWRHFAKLRSDSTYTAQRFLRDPDWEDRKRGEKLKIGRCFKYFAAHGILPIATTSSKSPTLRYRLITDGMPVT